MVSVGTDSSAAKSFAWRGELGRVRRKSEVREERMEGNMPNENENIQQIPQQRSLADRKTKTASNWKSKFLECGKVESIWNERQWDDPDIE